ncbi:MAG: hypothetical protein JKY93_01970 [Gammaproteobacteria bacterium]|nr:hypothetical protein [Gammaproteobacteria bacterium]
MLILNCTKAAADFFSTTKKGKKISPLEQAPKQTIADSMDESNDPLQWQWLVHAIKVKGKNVLVAMDYQTRFSITLSALKKGDDASFLNSFEHHLTVHIHEMMTSVNADSQAINTSLERYRHQHHSRAFYLRGDRSVQAHINDVAWHFRRWADDFGDVPTGVDLIGIDAFVNQLLRKRKAEKDYFYPQREFLHAWLIHYGEHNTAQADACIDSLQAKERADFAARHPELVHPESGHSESDHPSEPTDTPCLMGVHIELSNNVIALDAYRKK